jgi:hypothetical protein
MPRPRPRTLLAALAVAVLALTACNPPSNEPDAYDDVTQSNFLQGCTGIVTEGTALDASTSSIGSGASRAVCECQYEYFVTNVPFDSAAAEEAGAGPDAPNFVELNQQVEDDPESLPQDIKDGLQRCADSGGASSGTGESQAGSTVAPSETQAPDATAGDTSTSSP